MAVVLGDVEHGYGCAYAEAQRRQHGRQRGRQIDEAKQCAPPRASDFTEFSNSGRMLAAFIAHGHQDLEEQRQHDHEHFAEVRRAEEEQHNWQEDDFGDGIDDVGNRGEDAVQARHLPHGQAGRHCQADGDEAC